MIRRLFYIALIILFQEFWQFICSTDDALERLAMAFLLLAALMIAFGILSEKGD